MNIILSVATCAIIGISCKKILPEPAPQLHLFELKFISQCPTLKRTYTTPSLNQKALIVQSDTIYQIGNVSYWYKQGELHSAEAKCIGTADSVTVQIWVEGFKSF